jgi:5-(carboxyamino)imidazole ribonucleotide synthase
MMVGILGGGQLGRMLALAGLPLGLRFRVLDPGREVAAATVAEHVVGEYDDYAALADFVNGIDCVTYEFENVPVKTARWLEQRVPVFPPVVALEVGQDRISEKNFFQDLGVPGPTFRAVDDRAGFDAALVAIGAPAVLKTRRFGYDGKGQRVIHSAADAESAWELLGGRPLILERLIPYQRELSILAVRGRDGAEVYYPLIENHHRDGTLRRSFAPAPGLTAALQVQAERHAAAALKALDYVGVLAIEFFELDGQLLVNEMAPRVHNSGHWSIEGAETSQFENHLRAGLGWPLGGAGVPLPVGMVNLLGSLPEPRDVLAVPGAHLHLYGKAPRPGRKLGHVTVPAPDATELTSRLADLEGRLAEKPPDHGPH